MYFNYLGRDLESQQRCFARTENVGYKTWGYKSTISGTDKHPNKDYWYNLVWLGSNGEMIKNFIIEEGTEFKTDFYLNKSSRNYRNSVKKEVLSLVIKEMSDGYVFDDNDPRILSNRSELDTCTHYLEALTNRFSKSKEFLIYSKYLDEGNRLNYDVYKPTVINGVETCRVVLNNFIGHHYNGILYGENPSNTDQVLRMERNQVRPRFKSQSVRKISYKRYSSTGEVLGEFIFPEDWSY